MAKKQEQDTLTVEQLTEHLAKMGKHDYLTVLAEATKKRKENAKTIIAGIVNDDLQTNLAESGYTATCPKCGKTHIRKDGVRNHLQRYKCCSCGTRFTSTSGTFLEKSRYLWDTWEKVLQDLIKGEGINSTVQALRVDYGCSHISVPTVWEMRMKLLYAIYNLPSPKLTGVIQMDDTFIRETQKNATELINPLPATANVERRPRRRTTPSLLGSLGPEHVCITTAIDSSGHCVIRALSQGKPKVKDIQKFIKENTENITFFATDEDKTYRQAINASGYPHYIEPSTYHKTLEKYGYIFEVSKDPERAKIEREHNHKVKEWLWSQGLGGRIENANAKTYKQFTHYRSIYNLNINAVNGLHDMMDEWVKATRGVNTKYIHLYLALLQLTYNAHTDGIDIITNKGVKDLLGILVATRKVWSGDIAEEWANGEHQPPMIGLRTTAKLLDETTAVRIASGNPDFKFNSEDPVIAASTKAQLLTLPAKELKEIAKANGIPVSHKSKTVLVEAIVELDSIDDIIATHLYMDAATRIDEEDEKYQESLKYRSKNDDEPIFSNRMVLSQTLPSMLFLSADEPVKGPVIFITVKTTGKDYMEDEVIGFTVANEDGEVIFDEVYKPRFVNNWNNKKDCPSYIKPRDVKADDIHHLSGSAAYISQILAAAGTVIGWNIHFQLDMLHACHVDVPIQHKYLDLEHCLFPDNKYPNKNKKNKFYKNSQADLVAAVRNMEKKSHKTYKASKPADDAVYICRLWSENLPADYVKSGLFTLPDKTVMAKPQESEGTTKELFQAAKFARLAKAADPVYFLDTETTGVDCKTDEVLSIGIIALNTGEVVYDSLFKPVRHTEWEVAEQVNHISPAMVEGAPLLADEAEKIAGIIASAGCVMGWNIQFDLKMLYENGVALQLDEKHYCDLMREYCSWQRKKNAKFTSDRESLDKAMDCFNLEFKGERHNAVYDAGALVAIYHALTETDPIASRTDNSNKNAMLNAFGMNSHKTMANAFKPNAED